jgi:hypothetical protein
MPKYQLIEEGHTLIRTMKSSAEKIKVSTGEIVEIEEGLFTDGRLMLAGFQKIVDGIEDVIDGAVNAAETIVSGIETLVGDTTPADTTENAPEAKPEGTENATATTSATAEDAGTPTAEAIAAAIEASAPEAPAANVETTVEDDGKDEVTIETVAPKADRAAIMAELTALGVEFKPVGEKTADLEAKLAAAKSF